MENPGFLLGGTPPGRYAAQSSEGVKQALRPALRAPVSYIQKLKGARSSREYHLSIASKIMEIGPVER